MPWVESYAIGQRNCVFGSGGHWRENEMKEHRRETRREGKNMPAVKTAGNHTSDSALCRAGKGFQREEDPKKDS